MAEGGETAVDSVLAKLENVGGKIYSISCQNGNWNPLEPVQGSHLGRGEDPDCPH